MTVERINARLDKASARNLELLKRRTGLSTSEIIRVALDQLVASGGASEPGGEAQATLQRCGYIGCADGAADLAVSYKEALTESSSRKVCP